jgi:transposase InsO family protein
MKKPIEERQTVMLSFLSGEISKEQAAHLLGCTKRTIEIYRNAYRDKGKDGLIDHRHSNYYKLSPQQRDAVIALKKKDRWRSGRNVRDKLSLSVNRKTINNIFHQESLSKENNKRVKTIIRFEAERPNELWQTDIMGKIQFKHLGVLYLIATLDDHSRFVPAGKWYRTQGKMNVFQIWYESLSKCGLPDAMLQDEGSQYKARTRFGTADYEWYAKAVGIKLIWARSAQCKGKIERFWGFVQDDFVPEVIRTKTLDEVNGKWRLWIAWYNYKFKSEYFGYITHASKYHPSERRLTQIELQTLLTVEERRKVSRESTISLYGKRYVIPPGYIGCRIWIKIKGNKLLFEANGEVFWKERLRE